MSAGCACVVSRTGAEYVQPNKNALTFPAGDVDAAYDQVESLLTDSKRFSEIVLSGYETAERVSDPSQYVETLEAVIQELK